MVNFLTLNLILVGFLTVSLLENFHNPDLQKIKKTSTKLSPTFLIFFIVFSFVFAIALFIMAKENLLNIYLKVSFALLILGHARWVSLGRSKRFFVFSLLAAVILVVYRIFHPSALTHNLFVIFSIAWVGPFFSKISLLTKKRFIVLSILWFFYDIFFVWGSELSDIVNLTSESIGFPLGIVVGDNILGAGDLLWSNFFVSLLPKGVGPKGVFFLVLSNFLLGSYSFISRHFLRFPLLVLWVPLGIIILKAESNLEKAKYNRKNQDANDD